MAGANLLSDMNEYNPFPDVGGILLHQNARKVLCTHFTPKDDTKVETNMYGMKSLQKIIKKDIKFKTLLTEKNEILLVYADPAKTDHEILVKKFESNDMSTIQLNILTIGRTYEKFFRNNDPALYYKEAIFLKNNENQIMFVMKGKKNLES